MQITSYQSLQIVNAANELLNRARLLYEEEKIAESLVVLEQAYSLDPNPKTARKITRLKEALAVQNEVEKEAARKSSANLEKKARELFQRKDYRGTLDLLLQADALCPSDKLKRRIGRLRDIMAEGEEKVGPKCVISCSRQWLYCQFPSRVVVTMHRFTWCCCLVKIVINLALQDDAGRDGAAADDDDDAIDGLSRSVANLSLKTTKTFGSRNAIELVEGFFLPRGLCEQLYSYQREGVSWLWNLHKTAPGGILADDMGLGKTLQVGLMLTDSSSLWSYMFRYSFSPSVHMPYGTLLFGHLISQTPVFRSALFGSKLKI